MSYHVCVELGTQSQLLKIEAVGVLRGYVLLPLAQKLVLRSRLISAPDLMETLRGHFGEVGVIVMKGVLANVASFA